MQVREVDHIAVAHPVEDVPERPAEDHAERDLVAAFLSSRVIHKPTPTAISEVSDHQDPAHRVARRLEQAERDPVVLGVAQVEERQDLDQQRVAQVERPEHDPLRDLLQQEHHRRDAETRARSYAFSTSSQRRAQLAVFLDFRQVAPAAPALVVVGLAHGKRIALCH